jgi:primase-polymerase (primpol)-like protein
MTTTITIARVSFLRAGQQQTSHLRPDLDFLHHHLCTLLPDGFYVLYRRQKRGETWKKVPYQPTGQCAAVDDATTWSSFADVRHTYEQRHFDGIGYVLTHDAPVAMVDLDDCVAADGSIHPTAQRLVDTFGYAEYSPSGNGIRIVCLLDPSRKPANIAKTAYQGISIELYNRDHYCTLTGRPAKGCTVGLRDDTNALLALHRDIERVYRSVNPPVHPLQERLTRRR